MTAFALCDGSLNSVLLQLVRRGLFSRLGCRLDQASDLAVSGLCLGAPGMFFRTRLRLRAHFKSLIGAAVANTAQAEFLGQNGTNLELAVLVSD